MPDPATTKCKHERCGRERTSYNEGDDYCWLHEPNPDKDTSSFATVLGDISRQSDFDYFVFPRAFRFSEDQNNFQPGVSFRNTQFYCPCHFIGETFSSPTFYRAHFHEIAIFDGSTFIQERHSSAAAYFSETTFDKSVRFSGAEFQGSINFFGATINGSFAFDKVKCIRSSNETEVTFQSATFNTADGICTFQEASFDVDRIDFNRATFLTSNVIFKDTILKAPLIHFRGTKFLGTGIFSFDGTKMQGNIHFWQIQIAQQISFTDIQFSPDTEFRFQEVEFMITNDIHQLIVVNFINVVFLPNRTFFEELVFENRAAFDKIKMQPPRFHFNYCAIKTVSFIKCDMSMMSFRNTAVNEAIFFNSIWEPLTIKRLGFIPTKNVNIIVDEVLALQGKPQAFIFTEHTPTAKELKLLERKALLSEFTRISELYTQFKVAHDKLGDYMNSGYFYYNQIDLTRIAFAKSRKFGKLLLSAYYYLYFLLSGYGQKPLRAFFNILLCVFTFTCLNINNGFTYASDVHDNNLRSLIQATNPFYVSWSEWWRGVLYTIYHVNPVQKVFGEGNLFFFSDNSIYGQFLSLANSFVIILIITLFFVALQRQFKRY